MKTLTIRTNRRRELQDISSEVRSAIAESEVSDGLCVLWVPHTTAGVTINENADPDVKVDMLAGLERFVPANAGYLHGEGNSDSHIQSTLVGPSLTLIVENGRPVLGTWQGILFCEFDGPRTRKMYVKVVGE